MNTIPPIPCFTLLALLCVAPWSTYGDEGVNSGRPSHQHAPLIVRSRPVIERLPLKVIAPADVVCSASGRVFVADTVGKAVFRVASDGTVALLADELDGLTRLCVSESGDVFALLSTAGSGRILHLTPAGHQAEIAQVPFSATGLACDRVGNIFTTNSHTGHVVRIDPTGRSTILARLPESANDLVLDTVHQPVVLLQSGQVVSIGLEGNLRNMGHVPQQSHRLQLHPDGSVVALGGSPDQPRASLWNLTAAAGEFDEFAGVPQGTLAFAFDTLGNLVLANPELRAVTRVTSHFRIPCPHCSAPVVMVFSTKPSSQSADSPRSF